MPQFSHLMDLSLGKGSLLQDVENIGYVADESPFDGNGEIQQKQLL